MHNYNVSNMFIPLTNNNVGATQSGSRHCCANSCYIQLKTIILVLKVYNCVKCTQYGALALFTCFIFCKFHANVLVK